jgi:hypothetical protein
MRHNYFEKIGKLPPRLILARLMAAMTGEGSVRKLALNGLGKTNLS